MPDGGPVSAARAVSANGAVIVGAINDNSNPTTARAFRWTQADGVQSISSLLQASGVDLTGWQLTEAMGVSADGSIIVGNGINPSGNPEAWRAFIPYQCRPQAAQLKFWARFYAAVGEPDQIAGLAPTSVNSNGVQHAPVSISGHPGGMAQFVLNGGRLIYAGGQGSPFGIRQRNFTIAAWVNIPPHTGRNAIVDTHRSAQAPQGVQLFTENGMLGFRMQDDAGGVGEWITQTDVTGGPRHVAVTVVRGNSNGGSIYVDGARASVNGQMRFDPTSVPGSLGGNNPLRVGHDAINSEPGHQFDVDEIQFYWRAFPQPDMHQLFVLPTCSG